MIITITFNSLLSAAVTLAVSLMQVASLMSKVSSLEAQNSQLRVAAAKREQVLQQSRKFIEGHLARWSPGSAGAAGAGPAAAGAAGTAGAAGAGAGGATSNGVGRGPPQGGPRQ